MTPDSLEVEGQVALLETDTEGFEPFVFESAKELLPRTDGIYLECSEWNLKRYGWTSKELRGMLESGGFEIYQPRNGSLVPVDDDYEATAGDNLVAWRKS